jgi:hypothetical protein
MPYELAETTAPSPVLARLIRPHLAAILPLLQAADTASLATEANERLTDEATRTIAACPRQVVDHASMALETMRLKIKRLDCVMALQTAIPRDGISESALYQRQYKHGFRAPDIRPALTALIERGELVRVPIDPDSTKRGPKACRIVWRYPKEPAE